MATHSSVLAWRVSPRDEGAWWAAIYGVTQSRTRLKRLSSSKLALPRRRQWHPTPVLLRGKSHGQRSLVGYSPRDCKKLDPVNPTVGCHPLGRKHSDEVSGRPPGSVLAVRMKRHTPGGLSNRNLFLLDLEAGISRSRYWQGWFLMRQPFLACRWLSSHHVLTCVFSV